jgi:predicted MFS family arabinose efflux permease
MGWQRGSASLAVGLYLIIAGLVTPLIGRFIDKWGVRRVTLIMITLFAATVAAIALTPSQVWVFVLLFSICGVFSSGQAPLPYAKAITAWFDGRRGLALGIAMAGVGVGAAILPQVAGRLIAAVGWREAYMALGAITWLIAFPSVLFLVKEPADHRSAKDQAGRPALPGIEVAEAFRGKAFWFTSIAVLLAVTAVNGTVAHLVALLTDKGMAQPEAASMLVAVGISTIVGRLISGFFLDRMFAPYLAAVIFFIPILAMAILMSGTIAPTLALIAAICLGFSLGAEVDVIGFLVSRYFGLRRYGEIFGYIFAIFTIGSGIGPYLMGLSFDATKAYDTTIIGFIVILLIASVMITRIGPYRFPAVRAAK